VTHSSSLIFARARSVVVVRRRRVVAPRETRHRERARARHVHDRVAQAQREGTRGRKHVREETNAIDRARASTRRIGLGSIARVSIARASDRD